MLNNSVLIITASLMMVSCAKNLSDRFNDDATITDVIMYGDSLCERTISTPHIMNIKKDCVSERTLQSLAPIDYDHRVIFLALGVNDIGQGVSSHDYKKKLESIMSENIICVLPNHHPTIYSVDHRQAAIEICTMYIDPVSDCGVIIGDPDGLHYITEDYEALATCLTPLI